MGRKVGSGIGRDKLVDLDSLRVAAMPLNSVTYLLMNRPQEDAPIFVYNHVIKMQFIVQIYQLTDPSIVKYLHSTRLLSTFDPHTGWYPAETLNTLRVMALKVLPERINSFLSLPDSVIWEDFQSRHGAPAGSSSSSSGSSAAQSGKVAVGGSQGYMISMDAEAIHQDAAEFGFSELSSGLFVVFNRTLNTLRAYLNSYDDDVTNNAMDPQHIALTGQGAAPMDHLRTVDGIYLGKVLSWLKVYSTIMLDIVAATEVQSEFIAYSTMATAAGGEERDEPAVKRSRVTKSMTSPAGAKPARSGTGKGRAGGTGRVQSSKQGMQARAEMGAGMMASHSGGRGAGGSGSSLPLMRGVQAFELFEGSQEDSVGTSDTSDSEYEY